MDGDCTCTAATCTCNNLGSSSYGAGDNQITFSAQEIATLNNIFSEFDEESDSSEVTISDEELKRLQDKFSS